VREICGGVEIYERERERLSAIEGARNKDEGINN